MGDLTGLGEPLGKLIDAIRAGTGILFEPRHVRRMAAARADEIKLISRAEAEAQTEKRRILSQLPALDGAPEFSDRLQQRLIHQETRRQINVEAVVSSAAIELPDQVSSNEPDQDWLARFFAHAAEVNDTRMQGLWGKILAGEVATPGRFPLRTLEVLRNLSQQEAETFVKACTIVWGNNEVILLIPAKPISIMHADEDAMMPFLSAKERSSLADAGLLQFDTLSYHWKLPARLYNNGRQVELAADLTGVEKSTERKFLAPDIPPKGFPALRFTTAGMAIGGLVSNQFNEAYFAALKRAYAAWGVAVRLLDE